MNVLFNSQQTRVGIPRQFVDELQLKKGDKIEWTYNPKDKTLQARLVHIIVQ